MVLFKYNLTTSEFWLGYLDYFKLMYLWKWFGLNPWFWYFFYLFCFFCPLFLSSKFVYFYYDSILAPLLDYYLYPFLFICIFFSSCYRDIMHLKPITVCLQILFLLLILIICAIVVTFYFYICYEPHNTYGFCFIQSILF